MIRLDFVMNMAKDLTENMETVAKYGFLPKSYGTIMGRKVDDIADFTKMCQCAVSFVVTLIEIGYFTLCIHDISR